MNPLYGILNGSGTPPTVKTDPRYLRGCTWAFGRSTVNGSNIIEEGFCWSENPDPKVTDFRTTSYLNQAGKIYWMRDLKPATVYYMRAYAITKTYAVGNGDEETNDRINYAINTAIDYYWNNTTSVHGIDTNQSMFITGGNIVTLGNYLNELGIDETTGTPLASVTSLSELYSDMDANEARFARETFTASSPNPPNLSSIHG